MASNNAHYKVIIEYYLTSDHNQELIIEYHKVSNNAHYKVIIEYYLTLDPHEELIIDNHMALIMLFIK